MISTKKFIEGFSETFHTKVGAILLFNIQTMVAGLNKYKNVIGIPYVEKCAYIAATAYHESNATFGPYKELRQVKTDTPRRKEVKRLQDRYWLTGYYGMGPFQLTWKENYQKAQNITGLPLVNNPQLMLKDLAAGYEIGIYMLTKGLLTGVGLNKYINEKEIDYINARRTINILDKAELIAGYAKKFEQIIRDSIE